ncbi:MAG: ATP-binding protein [Reichenbachiella sp.]|uniref:NACHT domain-containing protein n=1 Tax=Reichenbachiella sp. TaxID=2184521 RepID=UPI0032678FBD
MITLNWAVFGHKFSGKEQEAFESLAYELFCQEHHQPFGIHSYQNQTGIETDPVMVDDQYFGFQAKFLDVKPSDRKSKLIKAIKDAKGKNPELTQVLFYLNKAFTESPLSHQKDPKTKIEIEEKAREMGVKIVWKVPSQIKIQLSRPENQRIYYRYFTTFTIPSIEGILEKFESSSFHLKNVSSHFEGLVNSHITRKETNQLLDWINNPISKEEKGIILLVGNAGYGKSVIIKDLYNELFDRKIPVLGIKADKCYAQSKNELQQQLDFDSPIETLVETLTTIHNQVVILIDQIDALSQSLSAKREYLHSFQMLINNLASIHGVRVIISVRTYDLHYDSDLRYYKNQKYFNVSPLRAEDVAKVLDQKGIDQKQVSAKLLELIRIPHHLNVLCKISKNNKKLQSIQTLHDLYNELWFLKITQHAQAQYCKEAIYEIASHMHTSQSINLSKFKIEGKHYSAIEYLKSNTLLVETNDEVQFFHQTFFDYCFARQFVESGRSVEEYILNNHQGLFIRAGLKMIMSFLRDHDPIAYTTSFERILTSSKFRFHIKLLLISELGYREEPHEIEKDFVTRKILSDAQWRDIFAEAINTAAWLDFLDKQGEVERLVTENPSNHQETTGVGKFLFKNLRKKTPTDGVNQVFHLFRKLLPTNRSQILRMLQNFPEFIDKPRFVFKLLYFIEKWDDPLAIQLFEKYSNEEIPKDSHGFYRILKDAAKDNLPWALSIYGNYLKEKIQERENSYEKPKLSHFDLELFKKLFEIDIELSFDFTLDFVKLVCEGGSFRKFDDSKLYADSRLNFFTYGSSNRNGYEGIYQLLIDKARQLSVENPSKYGEFVEDSQNSNSLTILLIVIISLQKLPEKYADLSFRFLVIYSNKKGFERESKVGYYVRELITLSYAHFTDAQKEELNDLILSINPKGERRLGTNLQGKKCHYLKSYGRTKYAYLCAIPFDQLFKQPVLNNMYLLLQRKFGEFKDEKPRSTIARAVPPPLPTSAYEKMSFTEWENSFLQYDVESFHGHGPLKGSKMEHSRAFRKEVARRPEEFAEFVEKLIEENSVDQDYILSGLNGLVEGKFDADDFKRLFKKALHLELDREHTLYLVWLTDYLLDSTNCDDEVISFICEMSLNHEDPSTDEKVEDSIQYGTNTVRGAAVRRIPHFQAYPNHSKLIFGTIEKVLEDFSTSVKATLMPELYYLMNLDKERTLEILLKVLELGQLELLKQTPRTAQYLADDFFEELKPYFYKALEIEEMHGDMAVILVLLWLTNKQDCYRLLGKFLRKSEDARARIIDVAAHYFFDENIRTKKKAKKLFLRFLDSKDEKVIQEYASSFFHLQNREGDTFKEIYTLLKKYAKSEVVKKSPHDYYEYLLSNAKKYPKECIDLVAKFKHYDKPDISESGYYDDDPVKILLGAYNSLKSITKSDDKYKEKSMKIFDQLLMDNRFRQFANNVTDQVDA